MAQCAICPEVRKACNGIMPDCGQAPTPPSPEKLLRKVRGSAHIRRQGRLQDCDARNPWKPSSFRRARPQLSAPDRRADARTPPHFSRPSAPAGAHHSRQHRPIAGESAGRGRSVRPPCPPPRRAAVQGRMRVRGIRAPARVCSAVCGPGRRPAPTQIRGAVLGMAPPGSRSGEVGRLPRLAKIIRRRAGSACTILRTRTPPPPPTLCSVPL